MFHWSNFINIHELIIYLDENELGCSPGLVWTWYFFLFSLNFWMMCAFIWNVHTLNGTYDWIYDQWSTTYTWSSLIIELLLKAIVRQKFRLFQIEFSCWCSFKINAFTSNYPESFGLIVQPCKLNRIFLAKLWVLCSL